MLASVVLAGIVLAAIMLIVLPERSSPPKLHLSLAQIEAGARRTGANLLLARSDRLLGRDALAPAKVSCRAAVAILGRYDDDDRVSIQCTLIGVREVIESCVESCEALCSQYGVICGQ